MRIDTSSWTPTQQKLWSSLSPQEQVANAKGGPKQALAFVEKELSARIQHLRGTVGAGVLTGRADKMRGPSAQRLQPKGGGPAFMAATPQQLLGQLQTFPPPGPLQASAAMIQPLTEQLSALLQGPLNGWTPSTPPVLSGPQDFAPIAQFANLLSSLLQQMGQMPMGQMPWPAPQGQGGLSLSKHISQSKSQMANPMAPPMAKQGLSGVAGTQRAQSVQQVRKAAPATGGGEVKPLTKATIRDVGSRINKASTEDDAAKAISKDPQAMALASPQQKGKIIKELMDGHTSDSEDRAITKILDSCTSKAEYDAVLKAAGGAKEVGEELDDKGAKSKFAAIKNKWAKAGPEGKTQAKSGPDASFTEKVAAFKQEAAKWKPDTDVPAAKGMTAQEAVGKFETIAKAREDDDVAEKLSKDPKAMALATVEDKSAMVKRLIKGHTTDPQDRAMVDILESCNTKAEFEAVMKQGGAKDIVGEMDHGPSEEKMNMLAGAWGHKEWANDPKQAALAENALADPQIGKELAGVSGAAPVKELDPATLPTDPVDREIAIQRHTNRQRSGNIHREPRAYKELIFENAKRKSKGQEPLDWSKMNEKVTDAVEKIGPSTRKVKIEGKAGGKDKELEIPADKASGEALNQYMKEKGFPPDKFKYEVESSADSRKRHLEPALEKIRKEYGVGKEEMRDMFTYRQGEINRTGAQELAQNGRGALQKLSEAHQQAVKTHGPESTQAKQAKANLDKAQASLGSEVGRLDETASTAESLYPTPLSGMDKFVGFFEEWGETILDVLSTLLNVIPGVGTALYATYHAIKFIIKCAQEDPLGAITSVANAVTGVGGAVTGAASAVLKGVGTAIHSGVAIASAAESGNPLGLVNAVGSIAGGVGQAVGKVAGASAEATGQVLKHVNTGVKVATSGVGMVQGIANGNVDQALAGLGGMASAGAGFAGGTTKDVISSIGQGITGVNDLAHGRVSAGLGQLQGALAPAVKELPPEARTAINDAQKYIGPGIQLVDGLAKGEISGITNSLLQIGNQAGKDIPGLGQFLAQPEVKQAFDTIQPLAQFANGLANGDIAGALQGTTGALQSLIQQPDLQKGLGWANDISKVFSAAEHQGAGATLDAIHKSGLLKDFLGGVQSGAFGAGVQRFGDDVQKFLAQPEVQQAGDWLKAGTSAIQDLTQGNISGALGLLNQPGSPLQGRPELQELLKYTDAGQSLLQGLGSGQFDKALGSIAQLAPALMQTPETQAALQQIAPFMGLLSSLQSGDLSSQLNSIFDSLQTFTQPGNFLSQIQPLQQHLTEGAASSGSLGNFIENAQVMNATRAPSLQFLVPLRT